MRKVELHDVVGLARYETIRDDFRRRIIELKRQRRVPVGDLVTFVFENRDTVLFQVQEMLRAERISDLDKVRAEIEVYNGLIPEPGELSSTMLIEITEAERIRPLLDGLVGIDKSVAMVVGERLRIPGVFEAGQQTDDRVSAVQYVRFRFGEEERRLFAGGVAPVRLVIGHPNYLASAPIEGPVRAALARDLADVE